MNKSVPYALRKKELKEKIKDDIATVADEEKIKDDISVVPDEEKQGDNNEDNEKIN
jgi:hypothetical protein